jgi:GDPmannose 4,6-dehydratase
MKIAFVTGVSGQDGAWLSKKLLDEGYTVYGGMRRNASGALWRLDFLKIRDKINIVDFDLLDYSNIFSLIREIKPDEFYNLAAQSFVGISFKQIISTYMIDAMGVAYILDALKTVSPNTKFYQASSSEMFGKVKKLPLNEESEFHPRSPYGIAKCFAHWTTVNYRESYNMFCCSGILHNHESELRGPEFVTRKITLNVARRYHCGHEVLELGNLDAKRDWGWAKEYCEGMWLMMQQPQSDSYVLATGKTHTVRDFVNAAFAVIDVEIEWVGEGAEEKGLNKKTGELLVKVNPKFYRPAEVDILLGDPSKAERTFGWRAKTDATKLAQIMVESDIRLNHSGSAQ